MRQSATIDICRPIYLTIRLRAGNFYEVIVNEGEARVNYRFIEVESKYSNCFSKNKLVFVISSKYFEKRGISIVSFFAKNSALSC